MQSKNAIKNLKNRYMSVLNKCKLLNTFGSLLIAGAFVLGASPALAVDVTVSNATEFNAATQVPNIDDIFISTTPIGFGVDGTYGSLANGIDVKPGAGVSQFANVTAGTSSFTNFDFEGFNTVFNITGGDVTITDSDFSGFTGTAITNGGTLTINAINDDVEFESRANVNAITNTDTLNLNTSANREIEFDNAVNNAGGTISVKGNVEFNKGLTGDGNLHLYSGLVKFSGNAYIMVFHVDGGRVSMQDNAIHRMYISNLADALNVSIDVDSTNKTSDIILIGADGSGTIAIQNINMIKPTNEASITVTTIEGQTAQAKYTGGDVLSPLYNYSASYNSANGTLTLKQTNSVNPTVQANAVAVSNASTSQFSTNTKAFTRVNRIMNLSSNVRAEYINNLYASNDASAISIEARPSTQGVWIDPYFSIETISPDNADKFDYTSYGFAGGYDSSFHKLGNLDAVYGGYLAFNMGNAEYTQNDLSQMEVSLGGSATFIMNNLYFGATANLGYGSNEIENTNASNTSYGDADYSTINAGVALLAGYNIELGNFILQPNAMLSYARIGEADYTAKGGFKVEMEAINAFEFVPAVRATMNLENALQVYADASVAIALNNDAIVKVAGIEAPEINQGIYTELGLGVQKDWTSFSLYGEANGKLGSRQGFGANAGFKYYF